MARVSVVFLVAAVLVACAPSCSAAGGDDVVVIDLTYPLDRNVDIWPGNGKSFTHDITNRNWTNFGGESGSIYVETEDYQTAVHLGTHFDAPRHMCASQHCWRSHEVPIERFRGPGVVIDISARVSYPDRRDESLTVADLKAWESKHGRIPDGAIVLLYADWGQYWGDAEKYFGHKDDWREFHFPGVSGEAAKWIVANRPKVSMVGAEAISFDEGNTKTFPAHINLFEANILGLENVANLKKLIPYVASGDYDIDIAALPISIYDASGGQARVVAYVSKKADNGAGVLSFGGWTLAILVIVTALAC